MKANSAGKRLCSRDLSRAIMATTMRRGSAAYKMLSATLVITTPLPSLENSSKRDGAQPKKTFKAGTFVLYVHSLGTAGSGLSTPFWGLDTAAAISGRAVGHRHGVRHYQAVICSHMSCRLRS